MKAIHYTAFGNSSVLQLVQVNIPTFADDEILVKVIATTVNPFDIKIRIGSMQKTMPVQLPYVPGSDVSGIVEAVGKNVKRIQPGDRVFATGSGGTYAEYTVLKENRVALIPANISANEAAALAVPLTTSNTLLIETGHVQAGQRILVHGAAGAVGSVLVQMAKALGCYVIGTASGKGVDQIKALGINEAIDYKTQDFTKLVKNVDLVADLVGGETQVKSYELLKKGGKLLSIVMPPSSEMAEKYGVEAKFIVSTPTLEKLEFGVKMVETGKIKAYIAKTMKLEQAAEAQDMISNGGINGKIVLEVSTP